MEMENICTSENAMDDCETEMNLPKIEAESECKPDVEFVQIKQEPVEDDFVDEEPAFTSKVLNTEIKTELNHDLDIADEMKPDLKFLKREIKPEPVDEEPASTSDILNTKIKAEVNDEPDVADNTRMLVKDIKQEPVGDDEMVVKEESSTCDVSNDEFKIKFQEVYIKMSDENSDRHMECEEEDPLAFSSHQPENVSSTTLDENGESVYSNSAITRLVKIEEAELLVKGKAFSCKYCNKTCKSKSSLNKHYEAHYKEKHYVCTFCKKIFNQKSHLDTHVNIHTNANTFHCTLCNKSFNRKSSLVTHVKYIHNKETQFHCPLCNKCFNWKASLDTHVKYIHTEEKKIHCNLCNKTFNRKASLDRHVNIHTQDKTYLCTFCDRSFNSQSALSYHLKTHQVK